MRLLRGTWADISAMALYWIIFGYAALMALTFPIEHRERLAVAHGAAMLLFLLGSGPIDVRGAI